MGQPSTVTLKDANAVARCKVFNQVFINSSILELSSSINLSSRLHDGHFKGRPRVTTPNEDRHLAITAKRNRRSTSSDMSRQLCSATGTTVSKQTVYRRLGHIDLYASLAYQMCSTYRNSLSPAINLEKRACIVDTTTVVLCDAF
ncbi:HTH_Tnp_Tc3_2 domain-containing protein [Trichonephila clavipes]|nr:HTH_Tnp_Tc3_2 domain-containing protein [Trichonephila clavipes]